MGDVQQGGLRCEEVMVALDCYAIAGLNLHVHVEVVRIVGSTEISAAIMGGF